MATRLSGKWLVLGIDLFTVAVCFFLAYLIRFNMSLNFDMSIFARQLPVVLLMALAAILLTRTYKRKAFHNFFQEISGIWMAISLYGILALALIMVIRNLGDYRGFVIPLSIIIIHSFLSFLGLISWRYLFKTYHTLVQKGLR